MVKAARGATTVLEVVSWKEVRRWRKGLETDSGVDVEILGSWHCD